MILLDTHVLVWSAAEPTRLSPAARAAIDASSGGAAIASVSLWELAMLFARGRLRLRGTVENSVSQIIAATGVSVLEITPTIAALAVQLGESFPRDPADRLITATAIAEALSLVTADGRIRDSLAVRTIW